MDQTLFFLINGGAGGGGPAWLDKAMAALSDFALWAPLLGLLALGLLWRGGLRGRALVLLMCLIIPAVDHGVNVIKRATNRLRPFQELRVRTVRLGLCKWGPLKLQALALFQPTVTAVSDPGREQQRAMRNGRAEGRSFPSAHTANTAAAAAILALWCRRRGWLAFGVPAAVGFSRVYTGSHWPSDVLAGALIGAGLAALGVWMLDALWRRWGGRFLPKLHAAHPQLVAGGSPVVD